MMASPVDIPPAATSADSVLSPKSPLVSYNTMTKVKTEDQSGVPLNTPWTLWLDKSLHSCPIVYLHKLIALVIMLILFLICKLCNSMVRTTPNMTATEYEDHLRKIYTFNTIQGFWAVFNNVPNVNSVPMRYSYHLMRDERRPIWEEAYNQGGGTWRFRCHKKDTALVWKELLLAAIGEQLTDSLEPGDDVVGLTVSIRERFDVVQVWNQNARLAERANLIGKVERLLSEVDFHEPLYKPHETHFAYENTSR